MSDGEILLGREGGLATLTINRPHRDLALRRGRAWPGHDEKEAE